jgi:hypothetical protein
MKGVTLGAAVLLSLAPTTARTQLREMRQTIFGMD